MDVGTKIREQREAKNYSQEYVAEQIGMSVNGYGNIERNQTNVKIKQLEEIAEVLECSILDFLDLDQHTVGISNSGYNHGNQTVHVNGLNSGEREQFEKEVAYLKESNELLTKQVALLEEHLALLKGKSL